MLTQGGKSISTLRYVARVGGMTAGNYILERTIAMCDESFQQAGNKTGAPQIEVTHEMVKAGVLVAREHSLGESLDELVQSVFLAMFLESDLARSSASSIRAQSDDIS